jgi:hypothetical protein
VAITSDSRPTLTEVVSSGLPSQSHLGRDPHVVEISELVIIHSRRENISMDNFKVKARRHKKRQSRTEGNQQLDHFVHMPGSG